MMKTLQQSIQVGVLCLIAILLCTSLVAQTSLKGNVSDEESGEPILFGNVALFKNGVLVTGVETDVDGEYNISNIEAGIYDLEIRQMDYLMHRIDNYTILKEKNNRLDVGIVKDVNSDLGDVILLNISIPLVGMDRLNSDSVTANKQIQYLPTKKINNLVRSTADIASRNANGNVILPSNRGHFNGYYIDAIRKGLVPRMKTEALIFIIADLIQTSSSNTLFLNFEVIEKGNVSINLINNRNEIIYNRTTFMNIGKHVMEIDFMDHGNQFEMYQLVVRHGNVFQKIKQITLR